MTSFSKLEQNLNTVFCFPEEAIHWLNMVWDVMQFFDDIADKDPVKRADLDAVIWASFVGMPGNDFLYKKLSNIVANFSHFYFEMAGSRQGRARWAC